MEDFLLTPNAPAQNRTQVQNQQSKSKSNKGEFAPLLNESINSQESSEVPVEGITPEKSELTEEIPTNDTEFTLESSAIAVASNPNESAIDFILENVSSSTEDSVAVPLFSKSENSSEVPLYIRAEQPQFIQQGSNQQPVFTIAAVQEEAQTELQPLAPLLQEETAGKNIPSSKAETLLLQQIQQLLNEGQNKGPISIHNTTQQMTSGLEQNEVLQKLTSPTLLSAKNSEIQSQQTLAALTTEEGKNIDSSKSVKLEGNRQDITGQYLSARIGETEGKTNGQFQQSSSEQQSSGEQSKSGSQPTMSIAGSPLSSINSEESNSGFQFSLNSASSEHASVEGKYTPGSQVPVPEKEIVNNLIQRFSVNPRLQTSKLTMQLHPAELGELKIDIFVKEGSIKANIVAQSQQVLDTLEKNMPRLRTVLEAQGFSVDSFEITMSDDSGRQQELFQEHFSSQQQEPTFTGSSTNETKAFDLVLDNIDELSEATDNSGVNVTV